MAPEHLVIVAITFGILSITLLAWTAREWGKPSNPPDQPGDPPRRPLGRWILLAVSLLWLVVLWAIADLLRWGRDQALWLGFGTFLAVMTLVRPWWFWEDYRARWLRRLIGDEPTALLYLLLAGIMVWVGLFTDWTFGRR